MADITRETSQIGSLLASTSRVEAPFVCVTFGGYTFGVYQSKTQKTNLANGVVSDSAAKYPNYVQSLTVKKINGTVNNYNLQIVYQITENDDPNFFDKLLSRAGAGGKIIFEYGDSMLPNYIYKDEEAIITKVTQSFNLDSCSITYNIEAWSASKLTLSGSYTFTGGTFKPSDRIKALVKSSKYKLTEVFTGMKDTSRLDTLIAGDDVVVTVPTCTNMSILEYIAHLVSYMNPTGSNSKSVTNTNVYSLTTFEDTSGTYGGPYFKVQKIVKASNQLNQLCTYTVDVGYPSANVVTSFQVTNSENWSIYYDYNNSLGNSDYVKRINNSGELEYIYSPQLTNTKYMLKESDRTWWTKVTEYPVSAKIKLKGLLRPAVLMSYIKLNMWFFGTKHIVSGYYIITSQTDTINSSGYSTELELLRVAADDEFVDGAY